VLTSQAHLAKPDAATAKKMAKKERQEARMQKMQGVGRRS